MFDDLIPIWMNYFSNKSKISAQIKDQQSNDLVQALIKKEQLFKQSEMTPKNLKANPSSHLVQLFGLDNPIIDEQYNFFEYISKNLRVLPDSISKIKPVLMRGIIHYFYLLNKALEDIESTNGTNQDESIFIKYPILHQKYIVPFVTVTLFCMAGLEEELSCIIAPFVFKFPTCTIINSSDCFSKENSYNIELRQFDSSIFNIMINYTPDIQIFSLVIQDYNLLIDNFNNLQDYELENIVRYHSYLSKTIYCKYLEQLNQDDLYRILASLTILISTSNYQNIENDIIEKKIAAIYSIIPSITVLTEINETCESYIIKEKHLINALIAFTTFSFSHAQLLSIDQKLFEKHSENIVKAIENPDEIKSSNEFNQKLDLTNFENKINPLELPDMPTYLIIAITRMKTYLYTIENNELFLFMIKEAGEFINSMKNGDFDVLNEFKLFESFDHSKIHPSSFILIGLYIVTELIRNYQNFNSENISFNQIAFIFNDVIFNRTNEKEIINESVHQTLRQSFFEILLTVSKYFMSDVLATISQFLIGSEVSICDEIIGFLLELKSNCEESFLKEFPTSLFVVPLVSYGNLLHNNSNEMKRFYSFLFSLFPNQKIYNEFFEHELFCTFVARKYHDGEMIDIRNNFFTYLHLINSEIALKLITKIIVIPALIDSENDQNIIQTFSSLYFNSKNVCKITIYGTSLINEIINVLNTILDNNIFETIFNLIYCLQYSRKTDESDTSEFNADHDLRKIYQVNSPNFSKINLTPAIREILFLLVFGTKIEGVNAKDCQTVVKILNIESLWLIHNIFKYNIDIYLKFFNFIRSQISDFFYHQILLNNSTFLDNSLNAILNENEDQRILKVLRSIVLISLTWDIKSQLLTSKNKKQYLSLLERCITHDSYQFPKNFAYISNSHPGLHNNQGIILGPLANSNMSLLLTFSFRFESVLFDEFSIFNEIDDKFSIKITKNHVIEIFDHNEKVEIESYQIAPKQWHRILIYVYTYTVVIVIDGTVLTQSTKLKNSFLSTNLLLKIAGKYDGLIGDIQIIKSSNNSIDNLVNLSKFSPLVGKLPGSMLNLRSYVDDQKRCFFYDSQLADLYLLYNGFFLHEKNNVFRLIHENNFIFSIFANINNSSLLEKAVYSILKFYSIDSNIQLFDDDETFNSFIFILKDSIKFFNDKILNEIVELFNKFTSISMKQKLLTEFLFNLDIWKDYQLTLYRQLIVNILPNIIQNAEFELIEAIKFNWFIEFIQKEESELYQSCLFNDLFLFLYKFFFFSKNQKQAKIALNEILFNDNELNKDALNKNLFFHEIQINHQIINEMLAFVKFGDDQIVGQFILRLFGFIKTQIPIPEFLNLIDSEMLHLIFGRFLTLAKDISIDKNALQDLIMFVAQNINQNIQIFYSILTVLKFDDLNIYQMINPQLNLYGAFLIWSLLILFCDIEKNASIVITSLVNFNDNGIVSSFLILLYLINLNSNLLTNEQFTQITEKIIEYINTALIELLVNYDYVVNSEFLNNLITKFIYLIFIKEIISNLNQNKTNLFLELNWKSILDLIQNDSLFTIFKSTELNEMSLLHIVKQFDEFVSKIQQFDEIKFNFGLIYILLFECKLDISQNSTNYSTKLKDILYKMNLESPLSTIRSIIKDNELFNDLHDDFLIDLFKEKDIKGNEQEVNLNINQSDSFLRFSNNFILDILSPIYQIGDFNVDANLEMKIKSVNNSASRNLEIEQNQYFFRSCQNRYSVSSSQASKYIVFTNNYLPIFYSDETEISFISEYNEKVYIDCKNESMLHEKVKINNQGSYKVCNLFYFLDQCDCLYIGGMKIEKRNVNFIVNHSKSIIELFMLNGLQIMIEFENQLPELIFEDLTELNENMIRQKIDKKEVDLIEAIILVNFLRKRSFNLKDNLPLINDLPATELINSKEFDQNQLRKWSSQFLNFSFENIPSTKIEIPQNELKLQSCVIGILSSPLFFTICNKRIFSIDAEGRLTAATLILPPRVPKATLQIFNRNSLLEQIYTNPNNNFRKSNKCTAFSVSATANVSSNQYLIAASFNFQNTLIISKIEMSKLFTIRIYELTEPVKDIISHQNYFVFISKNSNKVHTIHVSDNLDQCVHSFFVGHCTPVSLVDVSNNFIISISQDCLVRITHLDSLITLSSFSVNSIPKKIFTNIDSQNSKISLLFNNEQSHQSQIAAFSFTGKQLWSFNDNHDNSWTDFVPINENEHEAMILIVKNNSQIELIAFNIKENVTRSTWTSGSTIIKSAMNYDNGIQFLGYIGKEDSLNGIFLNQDK